MVVVDVLGGLVVVNETESASTRPARYWLCVKASVLLPVFHAEIGTDIGIVPLALLGPGPGQRAIPAPPLIDKLPQSVWLQSKQLTLRVEAVAPAGTVTWMEVVRVSGVVEVNWSGSVPGGGDVSGVLDAVVVDVLG